MFQQKTKTYNREEQKQFWNDCVRNYGKRLEQCPKSYVVFDFETNGNDILHSDIIDIGAVKVLNHEIEETYHTRVKPKHPIPMHITELTGITNEDVKDAREINEVLKEFYPFISGLPLVGHNIYVFDLKYLMRDIYRNTTPHKMIKPKYFDTLSYAKKIYKRNKEVSLQFLAKEFQINPGKAHTAHDDAVTNYYVLQHLLALDTTKDEPVYEQLSLF